MTLLACGGARAEEQSPGPQAIPDPDSLERAGALIGQIVVDPQNIFDTSDPREDKALFRLANRLHLKTRESVIREQLLFHSGDRYSQRALAESERILRSARYLYDASVRPIAYHDGVIDVRVTTRDVWTLNPGLSFGRRGGRNTYGFEIEELNILGSGTSLSLSHKSGVDRSSDMLEYKDPHVGNSWISLVAKYANNSDGSTRGLTVERPFYALDTPWAAGVSGLDDDKVESLYERGKIRDQFRDHKRSGTLYGGRSRGLVDGWTRRWTFGVTYDEERFGIAPGWSGVSLVPQDRKLVYPWVGVDFIEDDYIKERNHDQIGRTEDFHVGTRVSALVGWAGKSFGSDRDAWIFKAAASHGWNFDPDVTFLLASTAKGRVESGELRNAMFTGAARYYVQQSRKLLFFTTLEGTITDNLDLENQLLLGGDNGLRGYPLRYQSGTSRALLTVEERYFTNWYPFRLFRVGAAAFFDIGRTWGRSPVSDENLGLLKDVGVGLRFGNSRSGLGNIIHVDVAFPLDGDPSISKVQFLVETKQKF